MYTNHSSAAKPPPITSRWNVLAVGSRKEKAVQKLLTSQDINSYVPLRERYYRYESKTVVRQLPILPGYVFVDSAPKTFGSILGVPYVYGFLKTGNRYSQVTEQEVAHLRRLSSTENLQWCDEVQAELSEGTLVEIIRGPLVGLKGRFISRKSQKIFLIWFGELRTQLGTFELHANDVVQISENERLAARSTI